MDPAMMWGIVIGCFIFIEILVFLVLILRDRKRKSSNERLDMIVNTKSSKQLQMENAQNIDAENAVSISNQQNACIPVNINLSEDDAEYIITGSIRIKKAVEKMHVDEMAVTAPVNAEKQKPRSTREDLIKYLEKQKARKKNAGKKR